MDVRSIVDVEPEVEHNGTVPVWYLVKPREMHDLTDGGSLELVNEFEVAPGSAVYPHEHPTHEFYFVMSGRGVMIVAGEERDVDARRPRVHPARHRAQPAADGRRRDPLLLLRGRGEGRAPDRLHVTRLAGRASARAFAAAARLRADAQEAHVAERRAGDAVAHERRPRGRCRGRPTRPIRRSRSGRSRSG